MENMKRGIGSMVAVIMMIAGIFFVSGGHSTTVKAEGIKSLKICNTGKTILINKKEKVKLKAKVKPKNLLHKVVWKSSNKKVVSVSKSGIIRGKRFGQATIYLKAVDGSKKKAKVKVRVGRKVTSVRFSVKKQEMEVGQKSQVKPIVLPRNATDKKVSYVSSNPSVVSVSSKGTVIAKGKGEAVITARSKDGTRKSGSYAIQTKVMTKSLSLNGGISSKRVERGKSFGLSVSVQPTNASNKAVKYTSSNPEIANVSANGVVTGIEAGTTTIRVDSEDGRASASIQVEVYRMEITNQKLIAHRGLCSEAPENSIPAFNKALEKNFFGIECDIWMTLEGEFVVSHDGNLQRIFGYDFDIRDLTVEQIKKYYMIHGSNVENYDNLNMPTLEEYLDVMKKKPGIHPFIEIKENLKEADLRKIVKQVKDKGLLEETYFISMHQSNLLALKQVDGVNVTQLQYIYGAEPANKNVAVTSAVIEWCIENQIDLDSRYSLLSASDVYRLQSVGRQVNVWTVNNIEKAYELVNNFHVDMITTEYMLNSEG